MGLRFRKSVKICKGVKLNFSNSGTSVTFGDKGYHKTISSTGRVTTTVGLPGTGIYWTDSKKIGGNRNNSKPKQTNRRVVPQRTSYLEEYVGEPIEELNVTRSIFPESINESVPEERVTASKAHLEDFFSGVEMPTYSERNPISDPVETTENLHVNSIDLDQIRKIYMRCDESIEWDEIQAGTSWTELMMEKGLWMKCRKYAARIVNGDIDAYLEAIEELKPVDDLLLYCGDFEFGTDKGSYIEIEFDIIADSLLSGKEKNPLFKEYVYAVALRVARDITAFLPVSNVVIHVEYDSKTILSIVFSKKHMVKLDYRKMSISEIVSSFEKNDGITENTLLNVERIVV